MIASPFSLLGGDGPSCEGGVCAVPEPDDREGGTSFHLEHRTASTGDEALRRPLEH